MRLLALGACAQCIAVGSKAKRDEYRRHINVNVPILSGDSFQYSRDFHFTYPDKNQYDRGWTAEQSLSSSESPNAIEALNIEGSGLSDVVAIDDASVAIPVDYTENDEITDIDKPEEVIMEIPRFNEDEPGSEVFSNEYLEDLPLLELVPNILLRVVPSDSRERAHLIDLQLSRIHREPIIEINTDDSPETIVTDSDSEELLNENEPLPPTVLFFSENTGNEQSSAQEDVTIKDDIQQPISNLIISSPEQVKPEINEDIPSALSNIEQEQSVELEDEHSATSSTPEEPEIKENIPLGDSNIDHIQSTMTEINQLASTSIPEKILSEMIGKEQLPHLEFKQVQTTKEINGKSISPTVSKEWQTEIYQKELSGSSSLEQVYSTLTKDEKPAPTSILVRDEKLAPASTLIKDENSSPTSTSKNLEVIQTKDGVMPTYEPVEPNNEQSDLSHLKLVDEHGKPPKWVWVPTPVNKNQEPNHDPSKVALNPIPISPTTLQMIQNKQSTASDSSKMQGVESPVITRTKDEPSIENSHSVQALLPLHTPLTSVTDNDRETHRQISDLPHAADTAQIHAIVFSPYTAQGCKSAEHVMADIERIAAKGFRRIRVYGTDCNSVETIGAAVDRHRIMLHQGFHILQSNVDSIDSGIEEFMAWATRTNNWDLVERIYVGNEAIFSNAISPSALAAKIRQVKSMMLQKGHNILTGTAEPVHIYMQNPSLCDRNLVDFTGINIHPYFDPHNDPQNSGPWALGQIAQAKTACGHNEIFVSEIGFPWAGNSIGRSIPSRENQRAAIDSICRTFHNTAVTMFTMEDDYWKVPGAEQHFGLLELF